MTSSTFATDAITSLGEDGVVWLLVPKSGRPGHVEPSDISESAPTAGLQQTSTVNAGKDWSAARLDTRWSELAYCRGSVCLLLGPDVGRGCSDRESEGAGLDHEAHLRIVECQP